MSVTHSARHERATSAPAAADSREGRASSTSARLAAVGGRHRRRCPQIPSPSVQEDLGRLQI
eukprot:5159005-Prymnesium_polylepis.1